MCAQLTIPDDYLVLPDHCLQTGGSVTARSRTALCLNPDTETALLVLVLRCFRLLCNLVMVARRSPMQGHTGAVA